MLVVPSVIVLDASVGLDAILHTGPARGAIGGELLVAPYLIDSEVLHAIRRLVLRGLLTADSGGAAVVAWQRLAISRRSLHGYLRRMWELRDNISAYDAGYVALAESLGCELLTKDQRLARAEQVRCRVTLIPEE